LLPTHYRAGRCDVLPRATVSSSLPDRSRPLATPGAGGPTRPLDGHASGGDRRGASETVGYRRV
jgi:hypothetical protein